MGHCCQVDLKKKDGSMLLKKIQFCYLVTEATSNTISVTWATQTFCYQKRHGMACWSCRSYCCFDCICFDIIQYLHKVMTLMDFMCQLWDFFGKYLAFRSRLIENPFYLFYFKSRWLSPKLEKQWYLTNFMYVINIVYF